MKTTTLRSFVRNLPLVRQCMKVKIAFDSLRLDGACLRRLVIAEMTERRRVEAWRTRGERSLHRFEHSVYSQNGEDGVIQEIFRRIGAPTRTFVELGVGDGWQNNTLFLHVLGWRGWWIDGDDSFRATVGSWPEGGAELGTRAVFLTRENVAAVLAEAGVPREFDLLSLDLDQNTYHIWEALEAYRPGAVVIEYNAAIPPSVDWKVTYGATRRWDGSANFGASLKALEGLGRRLGYRLVHCEATGVNAFFVRDDLAGEHFERSGTAEHHYVSTALRPELKDSVVAPVLLDRQPTSKPEQPDQASRILS